MRGLHQSRVEGLRFRDFRVSEGFTVKGFRGLGFRD